MPKHTKAEKRKNKDKKKKAKDLIPRKGGGFDPAHPGTNLGVARRKAREQKRKKNGR